jgi:Calx-beta domain-containing protein/FG-GAP repeat protein
MDTRLIAATLVLLLAGCGGGGGADIAETPAPAAGGALGTVQLKAMTPSVSEGAGTVNIAVTRTGGSTGSVSVSVATESGSAAAGLDFVATSTTVQFADGDAADKIVAIPLVNDGSPEGTETFKVNLTSSAANLFPTPITVTIVDDDPAGTLDLSSATYSVGEGGGSIAINVTRTGGSAGTASVTVSTRDGSALAAQDYDATTTTVTFADGDVAPKTATIPIINDALAEPDETFEVTLSNASGASLGTVTTATITIPSNDQPVPPPANGQPGVLQLSASAYAVDESSGNLIVTVTRIGGTSGAVGATLAISPDTAVAGQDYVGTSSVVSFGSGDAASRVVSIPIVNDTIAEPAESFTVTLTAPTGGATLGAPIAAVASIRDNDPPASPVLTLTPHTKRLDVSWNAVPTALTYKVFLNPDGISGFSQVGADVVAPATSASLDVSVHTFKWPAALVRVEACNDTACTGSTALGTATAMLPAIGYLKAANADSNDTFGTSVAVSGDGTTVVVGVPGEDSSATGIDGNSANNSAGTTNSGAAYVFARIAGEWSRQAYVKASNTAAGNAFGKAVAISTDGSTIAIGAPNRNSSAGAVYVFVRNAASWVQQGGMLTASNTDSDDRFGTALALSANGSVLAIGAIGEDGNGSAPANNAAADAGAAYVFARNVGIWTQQQYIKASNAQASDLFGGALALNAAGNMLAVGATGEASASTAIDGDQSDNTASGAGAVYIFANNGVTWAQSTYIKAPNAEPIDHFGAAVALSADGNTLAVGAPDEDGTVTGAQQFPIDPPPVPQSDPNAPPPPTQPNPLPTTFQGLCAVGPAFPDWRPTVGCESGAVYIFVRAVGIWAAHTYIKGSNNEYEDRLGTSVALSADGNAVAIGAPSEDSSAVGIEGNETVDDAPGAGAAYLYRHGDDGTWTQQSYVKAKNTDASDAFGTSVAMSSDAATLVVGATGEASSSSTDQNNDTAAAAGAAYLY